MKKCNFKYYLLLPVVIILTLWINDVLSYSRRIGNTRFYLVRTMVNSKDGKTLPGLFYKTAHDAGYYGGDTPGIPKMILWNDRYLIAKNYDGNISDITDYIVICLDSINTQSGEMAGIRKFSNKEDYYDYIKEIGLSESNMKQTDNHIAWWEILF